MNSVYYIEHPEHREGPYDTLAMLRKIRGGVLTPHMRVVRDGDDASALAQDIPELAPFFAEVQQEHAPLEKKSALTTLRKLADTGMRMTGVEPMLCVIAGAMTLVTFLLIWILAQPFHPLSSILICVTLFFTMFHILQTIVLRINRGQRMTTEFQQKELTPALLPLLCISLPLSTATVIGFGLGVIPGVVILALSAFTPLFLVDQRMPPLRACAASLKLFRHMDAATRISMLILAFGMALSLVTILPLPLFVPFYASIIADLYDRLSPQLQE